MLSIIICSINPFALEAVKKNIAETAGVEYEIIAIDNRENTYGICKAYNTGGDKAKFPFLCFMHEDVHFETANWGRLICSYLSNSNIGLIGLAGGDCISSVPSSWSVALISKEMNIIQHYKRSNQQKQHLFYTNKTVEGSLKKVVAVDGVFMCTSKKVFNEYRFDEKTFTGFHGYDVDFSLQVTAKYNAYVSFDILVHHFSEGNPDKSWLENVFLLHKKWRKILPVSVYHLPYKSVNLHHWNSLQVFLKHLHRLHYSKTFILKNFLRYSFTRFFHLRRFIYTLRHFVLTPPEQ